MASGSCFTIKKGLIWNVKNRAPFRVSDSPEFILLNSIWKAKIDLINDRDRLTSDIILNIILLNISELQPSPPFDVVTFLEDTITHAHMKCSKVTVSSGNVTLYKFSYYALQRKLPQFNMSNNLTVLFLFSAPIELGLNVRRDFTSNHVESVAENEKDKEKCSLNIVDCLLWETKIPRKQSQTSPVFSLLNSRWKLEMHLTDPQTIFHSAYQIFLRYCDGLHPFSGIEAKTFLDHKQYNVQYMLTSRPEGAAAPSDIMYKARFDSIPADADGFEHYDEITVITIFNHSYKLVLIEETKKVPLECSLCQNRGCFTQNNLNQSPPDSDYPLRQLLPNFASLSEDLSMILNRRLMSDVQLKCEGATFYAHTAVLAARSQIFMANLSRTQNNLNANQFVDVSDVSLPIFRLLLNYLYTGIIPDFLSEDTIYKLYRAGSIYRVESLRKMCRCYFARNLREDNYVQVMVLALAHKDNELKNSISLFVIANPLIMQSGTWKSFSSNFPDVAEEIRSILQGGSEDKCSQQKL